MSWPMVITLAAVGLAVVASLLWLWWWVPKWQMRSITAADPKARADIEDNFRKTIGQLIGGTMVLVGAGAGAVIAYLQLSQQQQASHELLISNQVAKGFEQLGSDKVVVRLGGIYALEGVMDTSEQYHRPLLEALCAFVRERTGTEVGDGPPATDVQAALMVIGRRKAIGSGRADDVVDLTDAHIPKANLSGVDLSRFNLSGVNLSGADLRSASLSFADLSGAILNGANLSGANLSGADLSSAMLIGANLSGADLGGASWGFVHLSGAIVTQVQLDQACGTNVRLDPNLTLKPCLCPRVRITTRNLSSLRGVEPC
jgi:uncharacterized protein YjbI with pentapeptide repeats